jgi:hypothetical protein
MKMKYMMATILLAGSFAVPALAQDKMGADPKCAEYMAMGSDGQMNAMTTMGEAMKAGGMMASDGKMAAAGKKPSDHQMDPSAMMAEAGKACMAHPDGTVSEAMKMMKGG